MVALEASVKGQGHTQPHVPGGGQLVHAGRHTFTPLEARQSPVETRTSVTFTHLHPLVQSPSSAHLRSPTSVDDPQPSTSSGRTNKEVRITRQHSRSLRGRRLQAEQAGRRHAGAPTVGEHEVRGPVVPDGRVS
jgi:hypothetical protein